MNYVDAPSRQPSLSIMIVDEVNESIVFKIKKSQRDDQNLSKITELPKTRAILRERNELLFRENVGDSGLVLPKSVQTQIIRQIVEKGHFSIDENRQLITKADYLFPKMREVIEKIIQNSVTLILGGKKADGRKDFCMLSRGVGAFGHLSF